MRQPETYRKPLAKTPIRNSRRKSSLFSFGTHRPYISEILDILPVGVIIINSEYRVVFVNSALEQYFGIPRGEMVGRDKKRVIEERIKCIFENGEDFRQRVFATYENNTYIEHFICHVLEGLGREERWLEHCSQPIKEGPLSGGRAELYFDVTERVLAEKEANLLSSHLINLQEKERERLARDLHDGLGQDIIGQKLLLESLVDSLSQAGDLTSVQVKLKKVIAGLEKASQEMRRISFDLMPSTLESLGLQESLKWMSDQFASSSNIKIDFEFEGLTGKRLPLHIEVALFRIFQEALSNIMKHAQATEVQLKLSYIPPKVTAIITDNGKGFDTEKSYTSGLGLQFMRHRAVELGGAFWLNSKPGMATTIRVELPCMENGDT